MLIVDMLTKCDTYVSSRFSVQIFLDKDTNYGPVEHLVGPTEPLQVEGNLPTCLNGQFLRNGPNPKFYPVGNYHWFDGDGMLHGVRIKNGSATYCNQYVETSRLLQEQAFGAPLFLKVRPWE